MLVHLLQSSSDRTLQEIMLAKLAAAANLRREIFEIVDQYIENATHAELASVMLQVRHGKHRDGSQQRFEFPAELKMPAAFAVRRGALQNRRRKQA